MTWDSDEPNALKPTAPLKGRGAASYVTGRFASTAAVGVDDGWGGACSQNAGDAGAVQKFATFHGVSSLRAGGIESLN